MSRRYTDEEKTNIMNTLDENRGNVPITSLQTGVPERTLSYWRRQRALQQFTDNSIMPLQQQQQEKVGVRQQQQQQHQTDDDPDEEEESPDIYNQLIRLRDQIMDHIFAITPMLSTDDDHINSRAVALTRLLDRLLKLDDAIAERTPPGERVIRIEYKYPDGTIHDRPPWSKDPDWLNRMNRPGGFWGPPPETDEPQTSWYEDQYNLE